MLLKRYVVRWKHNGETRPLMLGADTFFTFRGAMQCAGHLNYIGHLCRGRSVAVVWDRKLDKQVSVKLYADDLTSS